MFSIGNLSNANNHLSGHQDILFPSEIIVYVIYTKQKGRLSKRYSNFNANNAKHIGGR